jgi:hypothetical protein
MREIPSLSRVRQTAEMDMSDRHNRICMACREANQAAKRALVEAGDDWELVPYLYVGYWSRLGDRASEWAEMRRRSDAANTE